MNASSRSRFLYVTFIRTTPSTLWEALTDPRLIRTYWFDMTIECGWKKGSPWKMLFPDGRLCDSGEILEIAPPRRMVIRWQNEWKPEFKDEGPSRCTIDVEPADRAVKLTLTHEIDRPDSELIGAVSIAWPLVLSNLKSLLEAGEVAVTSHPGH
jgi:uncharacterized protein YndB with AHSA1/START domain